MALLAGRAHGESRPGYGGKIVGSLLSQPTTLDPLLASSHAELTLVGLVFDSLYRVEGGKVVPQLAEALPVTSGLEARVTLRAGVKFHDGKTLKPADVVASLSRAARAPGTEWALAPVASIAAEGQVVVFRLRRPAPELAALLALPQLAIVPGGRAPAKGVIGTGPFAVKRLDAKSCELAAFADHFGGRPYLDAVILRWRENGDAEARAYEAGESDFSFRGSTAFAGHEPKYPTAQLESPAMVLSYLGFGRAHPDLTGDVEFRRGVSLALGRATLRHVGSGERVVPAVLPASPDLGGVAATPDEAAVRIEAATATLRRVRATIPRGLELVYDRTRPDDAEIAARVVAALDRVGIGTSFTPLAPAELSRRIATGQCDLWIGQLLAPGIDPALEYAAAFAAGGDRFVVAQQAIAPLGVAPLAVAFEARLPIVPLFHRSVRVHYRKTLQAVAFDALGRLALADLFVFAEREQP